MLTGLKVKVSMAEVPSTLDHKQWKGYQSIKELIQQTTEYYF